MLSFIQGREKEQATKVACLLERQERLLSDD